MERTNREAGSTAWGTCSKCGSIRSAELAEQRFDGVWGWTAKTRRSSIGERRVELLCPCCTETARRLRGAKAPASGARMCTASQHEELAWSRCANDEAREAAA
jgi:hypothetical protein